MSEIRNNIMSKRRDFVQETINSARRFADEIQKLYDQLNAGEITTQEFEDEYCNMCYNRREDFETEAAHPNNGCTYVLNDGTEVKSGQGIY